MGEKSFPGRRDGRYKGLEMGTHLAISKKSQRGGVAHAEKRRSEEVGNEVRAPKS